MSRIEKGILDPHIDVELPDGTLIKAQKGQNLRKALKDHFDFLYNKPMAAIHCRGMGSCGTCALVVEGDVNPPTFMEKWRLNFPPHKQSLDKGIRLACQVSVEGSLKIKKLSGRWGQGSD